MVTSDCGCREYFEEDEEEEKLKPWEPVIFQPSYFEPMHAPLHSLPIQRPESARLPNPEPAIGYPLAANPATIQQPLQMALPQVPIPVQNVIAFPQPAFQLPMVGPVGIPPPPPPQIPLQMPRAPTIGPPPMQQQQQQPPPGIGQPVPFGPPLVGPPPPIMHHNQPGYGHPGAQPIIMPPMNPHNNFNMNPQHTLQNMAAVQV